MNLVHELASVPLIKSRRKIARGWVGLAFVLVVAAGATLFWGGSLLLDVDELGDRADAVVVLRGSDEASQQRIDGALGLIRSGVTDELLLSVRSGSSWGVPVAELVRSYLEREYGPEATTRFVFCPNAADSTGQEAVELYACIHDHDWRSIIVVTLNYHTRRAKLIWTAIAERFDPPLQVHVRGVPDGAFEPVGWWRSRRHAKTWFLEMQKLAWYFVEGLPDQPPES